MTTHTRVDVVSGCTECLASLLGYGPPSKPVSGPDGLTLIGHPGVLKALANIMRTLES